MRRHWKSLIASLISFCAATVFVLSICPPCQAQTNDATLGGVVEDRSGAVIPHVAVKVTNVETGITRNTTTNGSGLFDVPGLNPGKYSVHVEHPGFADVEVTDITLNVASNRQLEIKLAVGKSQQTVTVDGSGLQINTTDASVSTVIDQTFVANLPLNGRSFQDLVLLTPGVVTASPQTSQALGSTGDFSVNGQRTQSNYYMVDGVSANTNPGGSGFPGNASSGNVPSSTGLGTTQAIVPVDALQEFRINSSTYSAEYGRNPGGQISFLTRSGTDRFHGIIYDYLRNNFFDANNWFSDHYETAEPALRQNDFGGTIGGPVRLPGVYNAQRKTFFFVAYEGLRLAEPQAALLEYVPSTALRNNPALPSALQPILNAFPLPTPGGTDYGNGMAAFIQAASLPGRIDSTSVRLDHALSPKVKLFFRFGDTPNSTASRNLASYSQANNGATTYTAGGTFAATDSIADELRVGYSNSKKVTTSSLDSFGGATPVNLAQSLGNL